MQSCSVGGLTIAESADFVVVVVCLFVLFSVVVLVCPGDVAMMQPHNIEEKFLTR